MLSFGPHEYRERTAAAPAMAERGMDALLVLNEATMHYLTGHGGYAAYVPQLGVSQKRR
ncbi:aminopeptidase P family N-terminal domain-containing protein [Bradyrhizobium sp. 183]|nr:aminopeptidase P family N-terminal domain-containing protein [Bradyrhizobium sp. 184]UPJ87060.1 aminopeptidase P family N-terminal domain-containing protein [Bradyrhizobium sp. 183]